MQLGHQSNSYNLMHIQESKLRYNDKINSRMVIRCTGACLDHNNVSILTTWCLWTSEHPMYLLRLNFRLQLHVIYPYIHKYEPRSKYAMHGVQTIIWCMNRSNLSTLTLTSYFTKLSLAFLFINKLTKPWKFNNMQFMSLNVLSDFMQVPNNIRKHPTKNEYFPTHILSTTICLAETEIKS
jgi:hypothetical protein